MPDKWHEITVKIVSVPYIDGDNVYANVIMFGNPQKWEFRMKFTKTLWHSIYSHLQELDNNRFSTKLEPSVLQESLEFLNGRIVTIRGVADENVSFKTKEGKVEFAKKFVVKFRGDLEEAVTLGGDFYKKAVFDTVFDNLSGKDCIVANSNLAKFEIVKAKEKELKKEQKELEKKLNKEEKKKEKEKLKAESEVEWVRRRREKEEKEAKLQTKLENAGW